MDTAALRDRVLLRRERRAEARTGIEEVIQPSIPPEPAARDGTNGPAVVGDVPSGPRPSSRAWRAAASRLSLAAGKHLSTLAIALIAILTSLLTWQHYVTSPWTRDGSVRVQVAGIAPQVSGQITEVRVVDNQHVHQGDVLYVIDPFDFQVTLDTAKAQLRQKAADLQVKQMQAERRMHLTNLITTPEQQQLYVGNATQARRLSTPPSCRSPKPTSTSSGRRCAVP